MEVLNIHSKILVIQTAFIGDAVLTLPMIQELKKKCPDCFIDVVAAPASIEIFENSPAVNKVICYDKRGKDKSFLSLLRLARKIKSEGYSEIYSPHRSFRTALLVLLSEVKQTYGFSRTSFPFAYKNLIQYEKRDHEVKRNLTLAGYVAEDDKWRILPELNIPESAIQKIKKYLSITGKHVAIAPGSVWETKKYPAAYYKEIIKFLMSRGYTIFLVGGKSDREYCSEISRSFSERHVINTAGEFSIIETVEILKHCELLISNDSAPTHFGMCANIPVLTIYCSTVPEFGFYPYTEKSEIINYPDLECKPCGIHGHQVCPVGSFACAHKIDMKSIENVIIKMLLK